MEPAPQPAAQQVTPDQAIQIAIQHHQAGRLPEAEGIYKQVLAIQPQRADALHLLGVLAHQVGRNDIAVDLIRRAIASEPSFAEAHYNLGNALMGEGKLQQARIAYGRAIEIRPEYAEAHNNLGNSLNEPGKFDEAAAAYSRAIAISPDFVEAHFNLANVRKNQGRLDEAATGYVTTLKLRGNYAEAFSHLGDVLRIRGSLQEAVHACAKAIELKPDLAEAFNNLGRVLKDQGKDADALAAWSRAVELKPNLAEAHYNVANALRDQGRSSDAIAAYSKAIQLKSGFVEAHYNLGNCLLAQGQLDPAVAAFSNAIRLNPDHAEAHNNLGNALKAQGLIDEALVSYGRAIGLKPDQPGFGSNRVYTLHFHPACDAAMIREEHRKWNKHYALPKRKPPAPFPGTKDPQRRLRIGYVSPDFSLHPVGRFLLPILECRDRGGFEIFCYSDVANPDLVTERFQSLAENWRSLTGLSDEQAVERVRKDEIDILVDLAMHTGGNRLMVFNQKPAPVQVTWLAYCSTTGLETIDYRFTDPYLDPPALGDESYSEKSIRLPETYWCYEPITTAEVGALPASTSAAGQMTFGCLNSFAKASPPALAAWGQVLRESPRSRLILHALEGSHRQRALDLLKQQGIEPDRVTFVGRVSGEAYFQLHQSIDIALDPFPCAGGTTTCDALWMGVPVVTLAGKTGVGRTGASILSNIGLAGLIARSPEQYVRVAVELSKDLGRLAALRAGLRSRMQKSPLMDAPRLARNIESAYREMWRVWCGAPAVKRA